MNDNPDHTRRYELVREAQQGRRKPGLALDVLGWPWHPRRLATARYQAEHGARGSDGNPSQGRPAPADLSPAVSLRPAAAGRRPKFHRPSRAASGRGRLRRGT